MIFLILSIICSTLLVIIFKYYDRFRVNTYDAIVFNYLVCGLVGALLQGNLSFVIRFFQTDFWPYTFILGTLFILVFNIIARSTQRIGVTVTAVAQKISFVIPVAAALMIWNEDINAPKVIGMLLAIASIYFLSFRKEKGMPSQQLSILLPMLVFIGSGTCDLIIKALQSSLLEAEDFHMFTTMVFITAFAVGLLFRFFRNSKSFELKSIYGGIALGIPNYGALFFLVYALEFTPLESSVIFPVNNVSIVLLSALSGWLLFVERFQPAKRIGLVLAVASILIMGFLA